MGSGIRVGVLLTPKKESLLANRAVIIGELWYNQILFFHFRWLQWRSAFTNFIFQLRKLNYFDKARNRFNSFFFKKIFTLLNSMLGYCSQKRTRFTCSLSSQSLKSNRFMGDSYLQFSFRTTPYSFCNSFFSFRCPVLSWYTDCQYKHRTFTFLSPTHKLIYNMICSQKY